MPSLHDPWFQLAWLPLLTFGVLSVWALWSRRRGRRRVRDARRSLMHVGALVDGHGVGRGEHEGMAFEVSAEARGHEEPCLICRVPVGRLPLAFAMRPQVGARRGPRPARVSLSPGFDARYLVEAAPADENWPRILPLAQRHRAEGLCDLEAELVDEHLVVRQPRVREHEVQRVVRFATSLGAALLEAGEPKVAIASRTTEAGYRAAPQVRRVVAPEPPVVAVLRRELARRRRNRSPAAVAGIRIAWLLALYGAVAVCTMLR